LERILQKRYIISPALVLIYNGHPHISENTNMICVVEYSLMVTFPPRPKKNYSNHWIYSYLDCL